MSLNLDAVGAVSEPWTRTWASADTLLYALAVGAGPEAPALTTENSEGVTQRAVPTFAAIVAGGSAAVRDRLGTWDPARMVHAGQHIAFHRELPPAGSAVLRATVADIADKGSGALVEIRTTAGTPDGVSLFESTSRLFIRGAGGFGPRTASADRPAPESAPDEELTVRIGRSQALLYRLCGDRNPLHCDPAFARRAGFDRPILHGLCTFGVTARLLIERVLGGDPARMRGFGGRFRSPVYPGDELRVRLWHTGAGRVAFRTLRAGADQPAIDDGTLEVT